MIAYKLFRRRKDGSLGPLFINRCQRVPVGVWLDAEAHPTSGFAFRPGWHCVARPVAPHLSTRGRVWCKVRVQGVRRFSRPESQGGTWLLADRIKVLSELDKVRLQKSGRA
jgi:hypothetical protein